MQADVFGAPKPRSLARNSYCLHKKKVITGPRANEELRSPTMQGRLAVGYSHVGLYFAHSALKGTSRTILGKPMRRYITITELHTSYIGSIQMDGAMQVHLLVMAKYNTGTMSCKCSYCTQGWQDNCCQEP